MRCVRIARPGGHEQLSIETLPDPEPDTNEVIVRTEAVGVNYADVVVRMGLYESANKLIGFPITPGFEFAGTIAKLGTEARRHRVGAKVFGVCFFGGYSSHVRTHEALVYPVPGGLSISEAAAFPTVHFTAWYALIGLGALKPTMQVLVHSAAGGVGLAALQLCKAVGARVLGVVGAAHKLRAAEIYGADLVVDKSAGKLWQKAAQFAPEGFDLVLDPNGRETLRQSYEHLRPTGRLIVYGAHSMMSRGTERPNWVKLAIEYLRTPRFDPLRLTNENKGVLGFNLSYLFNRLDLAEIAAKDLLGWLDASKIRGLPVTEFPLQDVARAHQALETGNTIGKLVLIP